MQLACDVFLTRITFDAEKIVEIVTARNPRIPWTVSEILGADLSGAVAAALLSGSYLARQDIRS